MRKKRLNRYKGWYLGRGVTDNDIEWMVWRKPPRKGSLLKIIISDVNHPLALFLWASGISLVSGSIYGFIWLRCDLRIYLGLLLIGAEILYVMISAFTSLFRILKHGVVHYFVIDSRDIENGKQRYGNSLYIIPSESDLKDFPQQQITVEKNIIRELKYTYKYTRIEILVAVCFKRGVVVDSMPFAYRGIE